MNSFFKLLGCLVCCTTSILANGQTFAGKNASRALYNEALNGIRRVSTYSYQYHIQMSYPNGDKDQLKGEVACDLERGLMLNKSSDKSLLLTNDWYYAAIHDQKTVMIYNLPKMLAKEKRKPDELMKEFKQSMQYGFPDSAMMSKGHVAECSLEGKMIHLVVVFAEPAHIRRLELTYDKVEQLAQTVHLTAFYPYESRLGDKDRLKGFGKGTTQEIVCTNYKRKLAAETFATAPFFKVEHGTKAVPVQYKQYHLQTNF